MRSRYLFLLIYVLGSCGGGSSARGDATCTSQDSCSQVPDPASSFLQCSGLPPNGTGRDHMQRLKGMLEATMDVYTFMRSSMRGVPLLSLQGELDLNPDADPLQNEDLVHMWVEVKMRPLLKSITKRVLSCLSTKNFSCSTYQTVVRELSSYYSEMDPVRQKWTYTFFMYPFLSGGGVNGCVDPQGSSEEWLVRNFGAFRAEARLKDFRTLNVNFSGVDVLHLLSAAQKAELLLAPELARVDNTTLAFVLHSLWTGGPSPAPTVLSNWTHPGNPRTNMTQPTYEPFLPPSPNGLGEVANGFTTAFRPIGSFVHEFVSFAQTRDASEIRSATLTQFLLNWTLAELAAVYRSPDPQPPTFDVTDVGDWYQQVVMPLLMKLLPDAEALMHHNIRIPFEEFFYLEYGNMNETSEIDDVCSITLDKSPCGLTDAVENLGRVLHCASLSNLTVSEATIMRLIVKLTEQLNSLIEEFSRANLTDFQQIFAEADSPSLTEQHLDDPNFIKLWFQIKLMPLLPNVSTALLSCLSTKNFSCPVYQTIVAALSTSMRFMETDSVYSQNIYELFIYSFLQQHNFSGGQCFTSANQSAGWLRNNFGDFSRFASITDFYRLNPNFSGLDALSLLTPKQIAEMLLLPLPTPPEKDVVISHVFDFLFLSPDTLSEVLNPLVQLAQEVNPPCSVYNQIFDILYGAIPSKPPTMEPTLWNYINNLIDIAPAGCVPQNIRCPLTLYNATSICAGIDSSDLQSHLNTSMTLSCHFPLESYACARLGNFTADDLVSLLSCNLPGNSSHSKVLWKMLLSKLSNVLDRALEILGAMPTTTVGPSASEVLDAIREMRLSTLSGEQLRSSSVIQTWFFGRLSSFLPYASAGFLSCLSHSNLSCEAYRQILRAFALRFGDVTLTQRKVILRDFVVQFLSQPNSGPGCVNVSVNSSQWLTDNVGPFSPLASLSELLGLNPTFNPLQALPLLTSSQTAELLVLSEPRLPGADVIINTVFNFLTRFANNTHFTNFLVYLVVLLPQGNLSCSSYKTLFNSLDLAMTTAPLDLVSVISASKSNISQYIPPGCSIYGGRCNTTAVNKTAICARVNSTALQRYLDGGLINGHLCDFTVEQFACASLSALTAADLAAVIRCDTSSNSGGSGPAWTLLLTNAYPVLDHALDLLSQVPGVLDPGSPAVPEILDAIQQLRLVNLDLGDPVVIKQWFSNRLRPFLPAASPNFLSCLAASGLGCNSYQLVVQILSSVCPNMTVGRRVLVYTHFIKPFLTRNTTADPSCSSNTLNSSAWVMTNLGAFSDVVPYQELRTLDPTFSPLQALSVLSLRQLAALAATPGLLLSSDEVDMVTDRIPAEFLPAFFDNLSSGIVGHENALPSPVRTALLQVVFDRVKLSDTAASDSLVSLWLSSRLPPLLVNLSQAQVAPFFQILAGRSCSVGQQGVEDLNSVISSLSDPTKTLIYSNILQTLRGPTPLRCYGDNYNQSFYSFLGLSFMQFQFPNLTTFLSLMPQDRMYQLLNSISPTDLGTFLSRPGAVDSSEQLCVLYANYNQTPALLQNGSLPAAVRAVTLPCVWPLALGRSTQASVDVWFRSLQGYLVFLNKRLISPEFTQDASCLAFQKFVSLLSGYNYTSADFTRIDVYESIRAYLTLPPGVMEPKCFNSSVPDLNSTAWFVEYMGSFINFLTLDDLLTFGSGEVIQVFTVNLLNIALVNQSTLPLNVTNYYTMLLYQENSNFSPLLLPLVCRCVALGPAFTQLNAEESMIVLQNLAICTGLDPEISAALADNFGDNIDASALSALGNESSSLSTGQILATKPADLYQALGTLSTVSGWDSGQASAIIQALVSSGLIKINSSSSLLQLGSLVVGISAEGYRSISGSQLIDASTNPSFLANLLSGPQIIQETFVSQIVSVNTNSKVIIQNVPDQIATEIPRFLLLGFSNNNNDVTTLNRKTWKQEQVALFFDVIGSENATTMLGSPNNLSSSVLQGFTCTGVRAISPTQVTKLVRASRRGGERRVALVETQLTCMYNSIKGNSDVADFSLYPPDVMLYYDYSLVPQASCRSYFQQLANANFDVFSSTLSYKRTNLFANARSCLGITNTSLTKNNILVLGNMCCTLGGPYIQNSDPYILEALKNCADLTGAQAAAVESLLLSGSTQYGAPSTWNSQTLVNLGMLPLYLTSTFYKNFKQQTKQQFLKYFLKVIKSNGVSLQNKQRLLGQIRLSMASRSKRSTASNCTVGAITQVTISDVTFPLDYYDIGQFNSCLGAAVVKANLDSITQKVVQSDQLGIVLSKLQEAYGASAIIPEYQVQVLGPASRVATIDNINYWSITQIDTLAALMTPANGPWEPSLANAVISKYLSYPGNTLGSAELNAVGGANLCSLDVSVLSNISQQSLRGANILDVSNCTTAQQSVLFNTAVQAFAASTRATTPSVSSYQLTQPYLAGTSLNYIQSLLGSDVNMDLATFSILPSNTVLSLTVSQVQALLGKNVADLKAYENQTLVREWIKQQPQAQLDSLGVGLVGGTVTATDSTTSSTTTTASSNTGTSTTTSSTTKGSSTHIQAHAGFPILTLLTLFIISHIA